MMPNAADALRTLLDEAKSALKAGELADLEGSAYDVAGLVEQIQRDVIGAAPERIARMADDLDRTLAGARRARMDLDRETRARLRDLLVRTCGQQTGSSPALAAALRRARRSALAALAAPAGSAGLKDLQRLGRELESRSVAAAPARTTGPDTLPAWIGTVETLLEQCEASGLPCAPAWKEALGAARAAGAAAPVRALAAAAESLAATTSAIEVVLLKHQIALQAEDDKARARAIEILLDDDLRAEERAVLEGLLGLETFPAKAPEAEIAPAEALRRVQRALDERRERARARLRAALKDAETRGLPADVLAPGAAPALGGLRREALWLAGAARIESLVAAHDIGAVEERAAAAVADGWRLWLALAPGPERDALRGALADLKIRLAGEGAESVTAALNAVGGLLAGSSIHRDVGRDPIAIPSDEDLAALETAHPSGARASIDLAGRARASKSEEVSDLVEQAILEARTLGQVRREAR